MRMATILVGITLCLLLLASSAAASEDYTLEIFGNANEDETINMQDVTYTELIILEYRDRTELADGKHDGKINMQDVTQIELVILGKEKELTIVDDADDVVTISKPVERVVNKHWAIDDAMRILGVADRIVAVERNTKEQTVYFPELSKLPCFGEGFGSIDYELILDMHPDLFIIRYSGKYKEEPKEKLSGIPVISMKLSHPEGFKERMTKFGYIFDARDEAEEYLNWQEGCLNALNKPTEELSEDEKLRVFYGYHNDGVFMIHITSGGGQLLDLISAKNIGKNIPGGSGHPTVDPEWVIAQNPEVIIIDAETSVCCGYETDDPSAMRAVWQEIVDDPALAMSDAVKNDRVHVLCYRSLTYRPGYNVAVAYLAKLIYPDIFSDMDPREVHQECLDFLGVDFDVYEHGVFVYPQPEES
jgi:iron complex transport system substrate-binding protein